jgi:hypothetical protein
MSLVHQLAAKASVLTGSEVIIHRTGPFVHPRRFRIQVKRGEASFTFGEADLIETKARLAMICDLVEMGFVSTTNH